MSTTWEEIADQPAAWRRAAALVSEAGDLLPAPGLRVCAVGCGTSLYMAQAWAALRERAGPGRTDAFAASELPGGRHYDTLVAISRSGTTSEVLHVLARGRGVATHRWRSPRSPAPRSRTPPTTRSCWTSPTSARWCRRASRRPR